MSMRISTSLLYATGAGTLTRQQSDLMTLQQQLSTGKRVLTPSDDPVAASEALLVSQSVARNDQQKINQQTADSSLANLDSQLGAVNDIVQYVRDRAIQAGNGGLTAPDKQAISVDVKSQFDALLNLANTKDANNEYLFSGYKGDTQAFTGNINGVSYQGDQGERTVQVSNTRLMSTSAAGDQVFRMSTQSGVANTTQLYGVKVTGANTYDYYDLRADPDMTGTPAGTGTFTVGTPFTVGTLTAPGEEVNIKSAPAVGDVMVTGSRDTFSVVSNLAYTLDKLSGTTYKAALDNTLNQLDSSQENTLSIQAKVGSQQLELDALKGLGDNATVQYADRLNQLVGVDYVSAISNFQLQQTYLQASQQSFVKVTGMSLFSYLN
jgi:flagellar hook-associated protein 3 FlgL